MPSPMTITTPSDREIVMTRVFHAPRDLVFDCWTKPELVKRWLTGPPGWEFVVCDIDLRVGGKYRYVWRNSDGTEMGMGGVHREIVRPEKLVTTQLFDMDWTGGEAIGTLVLTERDGITTSTNTVLYSSKEARDGALQSGMEHGMNAGYARLDEVLASQTSGGSPSGLVKGPRKPGEFCWFNMLTPKPAEAIEFFTKLLGWTCFEMPGMGYGVKVAGSDVGGLFDLHGPNTPPGLPPYIGVMVKVENADAACAKVVALGGKANPAFDVGDVGRMAVCFDPAGAEFDFWQPYKMQGTDIDSALHGAPCWFETLTTDAEVAIPFYRELFGWTADTQSMPGFTYTTFKLSEQPVAGLMQITPEMGSFPSHWGTYFTVTNADETAREATKLGGTLFLPPRDIPGVGRFAGIASPQGVMFYIIQHASR